MKMLSHFNWLSLLILNVVAWKQRQTGNALPKGTNENKKTTKEFLKEHPMGKELDKAIKGFPENE